MARYKCPCCGEPYNGKRCKNCFYETFSNETSCKEHHKEVIFDDGDTLRTAPRPSAPRTAQQPRQSQRPAFSSRRAKKKAPHFVRRVVWLIVVIAVLVNFRSCVLRSISRSLSDLADTSFGAIPETEPQVTFPSDGTVLYDKDGLKIMTDWHDGSAYSDDILIVAENTTDRNLNISASDITVNDYLLPGSYMFCNPPAEGMEEAYLRLSESGLESAGIETIEEITFYLNMFDSDTYETIDTTDYITFRAEVPAGFTQPVDDSGTLLWEQEGIRIICKGYQPGTLSTDDFYDGTIVFFLENTTDRCLTFYTPAANVNGESSNLNLWCQLQPGTRTLTDMYLYSLEDLGIDSLDEIEYIDFEIEIGDSETWDYVLKTGTLYLDVTE